METSEIYECFAGTHCLSCGGLKGRNRPFCLNCDRQLPRALRKALWARTFRQGFEESFHAALSWFRTNPVGSQREMF